MIRTYDGHGFTPTALARRPDGGLVASADAQGNIDLWEPATGRRRLRLGSKGSTVYNVAYAESGDRILFGTRPYGPDRWNYNSYAAPDRSFDLRKRTLAGAAAAAHPASTREGPRQVTITRDPRSQATVFDLRNRGRRESQYSLSPRVTPLSFGYLTTARTGIENLLVVGCDDNNLISLDPTNVIRGRKFVGHNGAIYGFGESPDGRFLVSGSADRTVRIWNLGPLRDMGWPDFDTYGNGMVYFLRPGGNAEPAGVRIGDTFVKIGGRDLGTVYDRMLKGMRDYQPGQRTEIELTRGGKPYRVPIDLIAAGDFVIPLLNLFVADSEWVLWTPSGYYDASPGGDRLIGWHVNRGRRKAARFYTAHQFRKQFNRPDVIDKILDTGDPLKGVELANRDRPRSGPPLDLRKPEDLRKVEPPSVTIHEPRPRFETNGRSVLVRADVASRNAQPVGEVKVLLNGRPISGHDLPPCPGDTETTRTVALEVELEPGPNAISVLATDRISKSSSRPQEIIVVRNASGSEAEEKPRAFVLAIGVSKYAHPDRVDNLEFAHIDARSFADAWAAQSGRLYDEVKTRLLINEQATVAGILEGFDWLSSNVTAKDFAVVFIAAHGVADPAKGYFIAAHEIDTKKLLSTAIPDRDLIALAESLRCRRALVFLDTCHAGGIEGARRNAPEGLKELTSDEVGAVMFGACEPRESSKEDEAWGHGAFTKALLEVFGDPDKDLPPADGLLSIDEIQLMLGRRVPALTDDEQHPVVNRPPTVRNFDFFAFASPAKPAPGLRPGPATSPAR